MRLYPSGPRLCRKTPCGFTYRSPVHKNSLKESTDVKRLSGPNVRTVSTGFIVCTSQPGTHGRQI
jgi:hypothetical protein